MQDLGLSLGKGHCQAIMSTGAGELFFARFTHTMPACLLASMQGPAQGSCDQRGSELTMAAKDAGGPSVCGTVILLRFLSQPLGLKGKAA